MRTSSHLFHPTRPPDVSYIPPYSSSGPLLRPGPWYKPRSPPPPGPSPLVCDAQGRDRPRGRSLRRCFLPGITALGELVPNSSYIPNPLPSVSSSSTNPPIVASARQPLKPPRQKQETRSSDTESSTSAPQHRYIGKLVPPPRSLHQAPCRRAYSSPLATLSGSFPPLSLCAQYFSRLLDLSACSSSFAFNSRIHSRPRDHSWVRRMPHGLGEHDTLFMSPYRFPYTIFILQYSTGDSASVFLPQASPETQLLSR